MTKGQTTTTAVSMLRAVNVAGQNMVKMSELAELYESLGFNDVRTYLQSGNVVFSHDSEDTAKVGTKIEKALERRLGLDVTVFLRTSEEMERVVEKKPLKQEKMIYITFLKTKPDSVPIERLNAVKGPGEEFRIIDREVFLYLPNGSGRTKLSNSYLERMLGLPATTRNWNTVTALAEMSGRASR